MKWNKIDLERYMEAKEYVDTILIPLFPFQLSRGQEIAKMAFQSEVLAILLNELEKELTGRVMLSPAYHYLKSEIKDNEIKRINEWIQDAKTQPFTHVFLVTFDAGWKKRESALNGSLLWVPIPHSGDIHSKELAVTIHDQVGQIGELIQSYWE